MKKVFTLISVCFYIFLAMGQDAAEAYPVSLSSFIAGVNQKGAVLQWKTVCYLSFARFEIQRSSDGSSYNTINSFTADKLRCQQPFTFTDDQQLSEGVTYYRVNVGDLDGRIYQGKIVTVINKNKNKEMVVYPTIVTSNAALAVSLQQDENIAINIIHSSGRVVKQFRFSAIKGTNYFNVNVADIMKGTYWVSLVDSKGSRYVTSLIKQ